MTNLYSHKRGFTLIETLVGTAVFVIVSIMAYGAFGILMDAVAASQAKVAATAVANEKFEIIRNLPYQDVGLTTGIPLGKIQRNQTVTRDGYTFDILTTIRNTDDPFDGTIGGNPSDLSPADYKLADLDITCPTCKIFPLLKFTTLVAPHALETASTNGAIFFQVFDVDGIPIPNASVTITNTQANPDIIINETTDNGGWVRIIDAPPGINAYNITATKNGYTQEQTYPLGGAAGADPLNPDSTVVIQQVTQTSLTIDQVSTLVVSTVDASCLPIPTINFSLTGAKLIGNPNISKFGTQNFTTNASGRKEMGNLEWDNYSLAITSAGYDLAGGTMFPSFGIQPNENKNLELVVVPHVDKALLVSVMDANGVAIDGASVQLTSTTFDQTKTTNSGTCETPGQVFWNGLPNENFTMTVTKAGYQTSITGPFSVSAWENQNIILTP